jgi:PAS domain S-box-containing protein
MRGSKGKIMLYLVVKWRYLISRKESEVVTEYIGRILVVCFMLFMNIMEFFFHGYDDRTIPLIIFTVLIGYWVGKQYDKAKYYSKELQKSKAELQNIFDSLDVTIWSNDIINQKVYVSKGIEKLSGYPAQKFLDDYSFWVGILYIEDLPKGLEFYNKCVSGESAELEVRFVNAQGEVFWVYMSGTPFFVNSSTKDVVKINGVVVDITERKKAEVLLQENESRYRSVVEFAPNIILIIQQHKIVYANPTTLDFFNAKTLPDLLDKSIFDLLQEPERESHTGGRKGYYTTK